MDVQFEKSVLCQTAIGWIAHQMGTEILFTRHKRARRKINTAAQGNQPSQQVVVPGVKSGTAP